MIAWVLRMDRILVDSTIGSTRVHSRTGHEGRSSQLVKPISQSKPQIITGGGYQDWGKNSGNPKKAAGQEKSRLYTPKVNPLWNITVRS